MKSYNKICGRLCVEMTGRLDSPLSVGSGEQEYSDGDVALNARGMPYIPGSSLAGALREYAAAARGEALTGRLFGTPKNGIPGSEDDRQSRIFCYDASVQEAQSGVRSGVKLNENKTAIHMEKYELQVVERDAVVKIRIEMVEREDCFEGKEDIETVWEKDLEWVKLWMRGFASGELRLGAKSRRGFGRIQIDQVQIRKFNMKKKDDYLEWLDWDWEQAGAFDETESEALMVCAGSNGEEQGCLEHCMEVPFHIPYTLLIRTYGESFARTGGLPDYEQMTVKGEGEKAFIPGSGWAGAFRSHIAKIIKELGRQPSWTDAQKTLDPLFGTWTDTEDRKQDLRASNLIFEETLIQGGHGLPTARIAVDRFTGGTVQGALYEEIPWTGGSGLLRIRWRKDIKDVSHETVCGLLLWAIKDLQAGILAIGGETSVGRGICMPDETPPAIRKDNALFSEREQNECMKAAALWVQGKVKCEVMTDETV